MQSSSNVVINSQKLIDGVANTRFSHLYYQRSSHLLILVIGSSANLRINILRECVVFYPREIVQSNVR